MSGGGVDVEYGWAPIRYDDGTTLADRPLVDRDVPPLPAPDLDSSGALETPYPAGYVAPKLTDGAAPEPCDGTNETEGTT